MKKIKNIINKMVNDCIDSMDSVKYLNDLKDKFVKKFHRDIPIYFNIELEINHHGDVIKNYACKCSSNPLYRYINNQRLSVNDAFTKFIDIYSILYKNKHKIINKIIKDIPTSLYRHDELENFGCSIYIFYDIDGNIVIYYTIYNSIISELYWNKIEVNIFDKMFDPEDF